MAIAALMLFAFGIVLDIDHHNTLSFAIDEVSVILFLSAYFLWRRRA
jgi:hypothetical protein